MFTEQIGTIIANLVAAGMPLDQATVIGQGFGNCAQALEQRGPVRIATSFPTNPAISGSKADTPAQTGDVHPVTIAALQVDNFGNNTNAIGPFAINVQNGIADFKWLNAGGLNGAINFGGALWNVTTTKINYGPTTTTQTITYGGNTTVTYGGPVTYNGPVTMTTLNGLTGYGVLYRDSSTTLAAGATTTKPFLTAGPSSNTTLDTTNGKITVTNAGVYVLLMAMKSIPDSPSSPGGSIDDYKSVTFEIDLNGSYVVGSSIDSQIIHKALTVDLATGNVNQWSYRPIQKTYSVCWVKQLAAGDYISAKLDNSASTIGIAAYTGELVVARIL